MIHTTEPAPLVRWLVRRDLDDVLRIERESFDNGWNAQDFTQTLKVTSIIAMVAEVQTKHSHKVVGYMIYELRKQSIELLNLAVDPAHRRTGAGRAMILKITDKLLSHNRTRAITRVRESNVGSHHFFKSMGWTATKVLRGYFDDSGEDAYLFRFDAKEVLS
jgi:ribosomal-protein-alanine N-acetyltransferase